MRRLAKRLAIGGAPATLALLTVVCVVLAAVLFEDDFETGALGNWTNTSQDAGNTIEASASAAKNGSFGMRAEVPTTGLAHTYINVTASTSVYTRFNFQLVSGLAESNNESWVHANSSSAGSMTSGIRTLLGIRDNAGSGTNITWRYFDQGGWNDTGVMLSPDTWYCVEVYTVHHSSAGSVDIWVDGVNIASESAINTGGAVSYLKAGLRTSSNATEVYFDDYYADNTTTASNGGECDPGGGEPTPTPTPAPVQRHHRVHVNWI